MHLNVYIHCMFHASWHTECLGLEHLCYIWLKAKTTISRDRGSTRICKSDFFTYKQLFKWWFREVNTEEPKTNTPSISVLEVVLEPRPSLAKDVVHAIEASFGRDYPWHARRPSARLPSCLLGIYRATPRFKTAPSHSTMQIRQQQKNALPGVSNPAHRVPDAVA